MEDESGVSQRISVKMSAYNQNAKTLSMGNLNSKQVPRHQALKIRSFNKCLMATESHEESPKSQDIPAEPLKAKKRFTQSPSAKMLKNVTKKFGISYKDFKYEKGKAQPMQKNGMKYWRPAPKATLDDVKACLLSKGEDLTSFDVNQPNGTLIIEVKDDGCGMTEEERDKLFQPFTQANKSVHSKFGGTGMGLWISSKLISAMGGTIECNSQLSKGTSFIVKVPTKYQQSPEKCKLSLEKLSIFGCIRAICLVKNFSTIEKIIQKIGGKPICCQNLCKLLSKLDVIFSHINLLEI